MMCNIKQYTKTRLHCLTVAFTVYVIVYVPVYVT